MYRLITHTDLDGVGCEIIFREAFGDENVKVTTADYGDVDEKVLDELKELDSDDMLFITDLNIKKETAEIVNDYAKTFKIMLIDHHKTSTHLVDYPWCIVNINNTACGTKMFKEFLEDGGYDLSFYNDFARIVDDYDRWIHLYPHSKKHNDLYYLIGREDYVDRMLSQPNIDLNTIEMSLLDVEQNRKERYMKSLLDKVNSVLIEYYEDDKFKYINLPYVFAEQYTSELGNYILQNIEIPVIAIINMKNNKVSFRSQKYFDCSIIAKYYGGGGHPQASGFELGGDLTDALCNVIFTK